MRRAWLAAQVLLAALVLWFVGRSMARNWTEIRGSLDLVVLEPAGLAAAALIILATYALLISAWRAVLLGWGEQLAWPSAARIWCLSNLARYVPGRVWQIAGMAAMARQAGVSPWAAAGSAIVVQLLSIATGALVSGLLAIRTGYPALIAVCGLLALAGVAVLASAPATALAARLLSRATGRPVRIDPVGKGALAASAAVTTAAWIAYGVSLYYLAQGLLGEPRLSIGLAIGAFAASYLVGYLLIFLPAGLGARESTIYLLLQGPLGPGAATVVMIGSRLLMTATELVAGAITLPLTATTHGNSPRP